MSIQRQYNRYQQLGIVGALARPNSPHIVERGQVGVEVRPGEGVYYDASTNRWIKPTNTATRLLVTGIVTFEQGTVQSAVSGGTPAGANSDQELVFAAGSSVRIMTAGDIYLLAGAALERDGGLVFAQADNDWVAAPTATASLIASPRKSINVITDQVADGDIFIARIGHGMNY